MLTLRISRQELAQFRAWKAALPPDLPRLSQHAALHPACLAFDWSVSDIELARANRTTVPAVRHWRKVLGHPNAPRTVLAAGVRPKHPAAHYASLDWSKHDARLAVETQLTRERIRQIRAELGKPKANLHSSYERFRALFPKATALRFRTARETFPSLARASFNRYCATAGIVVLHDRPNRYPWHLVNLALPPVELAKIWPIPIRTLHQARARRYPPNPVRRTDPALPQLLAAETAKAADFLASQVTHLA